MTTHDVHRRMEENLFGAFQRQHPSTTFGSFRSLSSASDLLSLPNHHQYQPQQQQRRHIATSVTGVNTNNSNTMPLQYKCRPSSDILQAQPTIRDKSSSPEAEAIDRWFENIQRYEQMLEEVAAASLDQSFKDELYHINQWLRCRSDAERTATLYTIVQNASQIQIRFLITVLQKLASSSNNNDPYPAGQDNNSSNSVTSDFHQYQHAFNNSSSTNLKKTHSFSSSHSVMSTESESTKRQLYPPTSRRPPMTSQKLTGAMSEPDDLRRRNRDLFVSRPLGLSHPGPLYEKAMQARAQLQAMNTNNETSSGTSSTTNSTLSTSSSSSLKSNSILLSTTPRIRASLSTSTSSENSTSKSLFSNGDWPFPLNAKSDDSSSWSFGSLQKKKPVVSTSTTKKEDLLPWAIQEEEVSEPLPSLLKSNTMSALEQAQERLRGEQKVISPPKVALPTTTPQFMNLPGEDNNTDDDDQSDTSSNREKPLTGLARRRKRSSAARALKDKLAAETVDFDLMQDVQGWLRSLRLHKYGHAFIGLDWKQVIRMSDQDMIDAGVNTIGARRKLLKVFENVQRHCQENSIEF